MRNPKNLTFWPIVVEFIKGVYQFTTVLPDSERYNLISQVKRSAVSVRLNIVEGAACESALEYARFLEIAYRSAKEAITCIELTAELGLCPFEATSELVMLGDRVAGAIHAYRKSIRNHC